MSQTDDRARAEAERLEALRKYEILDTEPEMAYDDLALLASHICETPMAAITMVDADRQWFKARVGMPVPETRARPDRPGVPQAPGLAAQNECLKNAHRGRSITHPRPRWIRDRASAESSWMKMENRSQVHVCIRASNTRSARAMNRPFAVCRSPEAPAWPAAICVFR